MRSRAFATAASLAAALALSSAYAADTNSATKTGTPDKGTQSSVNAVPPSSASNSAATDTSTSNSSSTGSSYSSNASDPNYDKETGKKHEGFFHKLLHPSEWGKKDTASTSK